MPRHLFIVSTNHPELHDYLKEQFEEDTNVEVILDRRLRERRAASAHRDAERRVSDRRSRPEIDAQLQCGSHAFVTLTDAATLGT
jgi:hypothetical protein